MTVYLGAMFYPEPVFWPKADFSSCSIIDCHDFCFIGESKPTSGSPFCVERKLVETGDWLVLRVNHLHPHPKHL